MSYSSPGTGFRTWHVLGFLGLMMLVADVLAVRLLSTKSDQVTFVFAPAPRPPVEMVEVLVASEDLPVGTTFTRDELKALVKIKKAPLNGLPAAYLTNSEDLVGKMLSRPVRAEETFDPNGLSNPPLLTLLDKYDVVSLPIAAQSRVSGFIGPGSRVNVLATLRTGDTTRPFPLLVNVLVLTVDTDVATEVSWISFNTVSFAVTAKQALTLALAKSHGCALEVLLRNPNRDAETDKNYDIDAVIKLLAALEVAPAPRAVR